MPAGHLGAVLQRKISDTVDALRQAGLQTPGFANRLNVKFWKGIGRLTQLDRQHCEPFPKSSHQNIYIIDRSKQSVVDHHLE
jgi:hypothetical protein